MIPQFTTDQCGILIGMSSTPTGVTEDVFFNEHIKDNLFHRYKKGRETNIKRNAFNDNHLYEPIGYKTFGDNNLMFFSLFDDFSYPNRVFHPFNGNGDSVAKYQNYEYQVVVGINILHSGCNCGNDTLEHLFSIDKLQIFPFSCVTKLKANPIFLCGNGLDYIELIKAHIYITSSENKIHTIIANGVGSDEVIIISFANSMRAIAESIFRIRNLQFKELATVNDTWFNQVLSNSFATENEEKDIKDAHVFSYSYSTCGYAIDRSEIPTELPDDNCKITFTWTIKPGHITNFTKELKLRMEQLELGKTAWKDCLYVSNTKVCLSLEHHILGEDSERFFRTLDGLRELDFKKRNIRKLHIDISVEDNNNLLDGSISETDLEKHPNTKDTFKRYTYSKEKLSDIRNDLDKARISKVIKERIMKMYHNYDDCVQDPAFVVSFIGLKPFLDFLADTIKIYSEGKSTRTSDIMHEWLDNSLRDFEQAYLNRFHQSNRMRTLSDFNLEWNGGIQQIISSMDYTYKLLMKCCSVDSPRSFMYISGYERVHVTDHSYRINMQHVTYPELFVTTVWKEMFNFIPTEITKIYNKEDLPLKFFSDDNFINRLKIQIYNHHMYNPADNINASFLSNLNKELMVSILADSLAFFYGYGKDYRLFEFWYWRYFMQTPMIYNSRGDIDQNRFFLFMVRMLFVKILESGNPDSIESLRFKPFDSAFSSNWVLFFENASAISKILYEQLEQLDYGLHIKSLSSVLLHYTYPDAGKILEGKSELKDKKDFMRAEMNLISSLRNKVYQECSDFFNDRTIPTTQFESEYIANFVCGFLTGYLHHIRSLDDTTTDTEYERLLSRDKSGHPDISNQFSKFYKPLLADPLGGFFCIDGDIIKEYFSARSVFYMTMFHLYHKNITKFITH